MKIFVYVVEWIVSFFIIWFFYFASYYLFQKKFNSITSVIFSFVAVGLVCFLSAPYVLSFPKPSAIYLPFVIFWFIVYLIRSAKNSS